MRIRMRSFGLVAALVLAGCTKPEPQPVASVEETQPGPSPEPAPHPVSAELQATIVPPDDPTARVKNCNLPEALANRIRDAKERLDQLLLKYSNAHPYVVQTR